MPTPKTQTSDKLPPNEHTFTINVVGEVTKQTSHGSFTCRRVLNLGQRAEADLVEARMNQGLKEIRPATQTLHYVLSQLYVRITKAPAWWINSFLPEEGVPGKTLMDLNVISAIFAECMQAEADFRLEVWGPDEPPKPAIEESEEPSEAPGAS